MYKNSKANRMRYAAIAAEKQREWIATRDYSGYEDNDAVRDADQKHLEMLEYEAQHGVLPPPSPR